MSEKTTKSREMSPARLARVQAVTAAFVRMAEGKGTAEDQKVASSASASDIREAHKAMGRVGERGARSEVDVTVNGRNGSAVGWREWYATKALAAATGGSITVVIMPEGVKDAKPVPQAKIAALFDRLEKIQDGETPAKLAREVAGAK